MHGRTERPECYLSDRETEQNTTMVINTSPFKPLLLYGVYINPFGEQDVSSHQEY